MLVIKLKFNGNCGLIIESIYILSSGSPLHLTSTDAFQQGVDELLQYFYNCQFPRHTVEILWSLQDEATEYCTLASQVRNSLKCVAGEGQVHSVYKPRILHRRSGTVHYNFSESPSFLIRSMTHRPRMDHT